MWNQTAWPEEIDVISTTSTAARARNTSELSASIKAAGGALTVNPNDSAYIVAVNNSLRFTVTRLANGQYRITESSNLWLVLGVAGLIGLVFLSRR